MKIRLDKKTYNKVMIGKNKIRVLPGSILITQQEWERVKEYIQRIWNTLRPFDSSFIGFARFDCFGYTKRKKPLIYDNCFDFGECDGLKLIEFNCGSPECASTTSLIRSECSYIPKATKALANEIVKTFGQEISFVAGDGALKQLTVNAFIEELRKTLDLEVCSEKDILENNFSNNVIWAWGDIKPNESECEFSQDFIQKLEELEKKGIKIFNSPLGTLLSDKSLLLKSGLVKGGIIEDGNLQSFLKDPREWVFKPLFGSGGEDVFFKGKVIHSYTQKQTLLKKLKERSYGAFEYYEPPKILIPEIGWVTYDWNPAVWIENGEIQKMLYIVIRMNPLSTFTGLHNVSGGGSYGGIVEKINK